MGSNGGISDFSGSLMPNLSKSTSHKQYFGNSETCDVYVSVSPFGNRGRRGARDAGGPCVHTDVERELGHHAHKSRLFPTPGAGLG